VIRHEERVDGDAVADVVATPTTLALESEALVQPNRRLVPRKHVELELRDARRTGPGDRGLEKRPADSAPPVTRGDHHPEIRHVRARGMGVARERQPADDEVVVHGDEDGGIGVSTDCLQVATLVGDRPPRLRREEPAPRLLTDGGGEGDELGGIRGVGMADRDHPTTTP
jgi:hypothetical protein